MPIARASAARPHPEQGFRTCLGIRRLTQEPTTTRASMPPAGAASSIKARSVASIRSILKNGLDRAFLDEAEQGEREPVRYGNIRGRDYFH